MPPLLLLLWWWLLPWLARQQRSAPAVVTLCAGTASSIRSTRLSYAAKMHAGCNAHRLLWPAEELVDPHAHLHCRQAARV